MLTLFKQSEMFKGDYHQDCHEFLMWFLNEINDVLINDGKKRDRSFEFL